MTWYIIMYTPFPLPSTSYLFSSAFNIININIIGDSHFKYLNSEHQTRILAINNHPMKFKIKQSHFTLDKFEYTNIN